MQLVVCWEVWFDILVFVFEILVLYFRCFVLLSQGVCLLLRKFFYGIVFFFVWVFWSFVIFIVNYSDFFFSCGEMFVGEVIIIEFCYGGRWFRKRDSGYSYCSCEIWLYFRIIRVLDSIYFWVLQFFFEIAECIFFNKFFWIFEVQLGLRIIVISILRVLRGMVKDVGFGVRLFGLVLRFLFIICGI